MVLSAEDERSIRGAVDSSLLSGPIMEGEKDTL